MAAEVEIIVIGNELLLGDVLDTNTHWLCHQVASVGGGVRRVVMIRDDVATISGEICQTLGRQPALLLLGGGLGPTDDDLTLQAVSVATRCPMQLDDAALQMVALAYARFAQAGHVASGELNESRKKMAMIPKGSQPLHNPVGAAPGILLQFGPTYLVALPGVPEELKGIFQTSLTPLLRELFGAGAAAQRTLTVNCGDESALTEALRSATEQHPRVYIKSRARKYGDAERLAITLHAAAHDAGQAQQLIHAATEELTKQLSRRGISVHSIQ